ncbi:2-oxo-hept-4-ene-1,7-dioate hydratase [Pseudoteredinibacter isoporae]|uniref:2-oxo-hept-3-ene-1,7-dioate hydratase n=1 Tax=Pseudoteredinibacter isoporae TaxID=570281 RepID=A0A7X0JXF5_9GAMM|nr:2-oxo-hepta-3-ene-1,7-dioic acid hydratase [Pseudoteredinibacter isoporae]MBB6523056.1 2-oxo-hept-3-ene-1,7-dioate hydratase [Pseudoteredinibacter isoporae]
MQAEDIKQAAEELYHAERNRQPVDPVTLRFPDMEIADSYAIQQQWVNRKIDDGRKVVGYKIGYTSRAMQKALNINEPDYGVLLDDMVFADGSDIEVSQFCDPRLEMELAFILKEELSGENVSVFDVLNATDYVVPALEIIAARSHRVHPESQYKRTVRDTIADNAGNAGIIMGGCPIKPDARDLRWCGGMLYLNGLLEETGLAAAVLNHPANGVSWVAKRFAPHGVSLKPGQIILSGSFTAPIPVKAGDTIHADYGPLGGISCHFV